jgi:hypothetical protein
MAAVVTMLTLITGCDGDRGKAGQRGETPKIVVAMEKTSEGLRDAKLVAEEINGYILISRKIIHRFLFQKPQVWLSAF